MITVEWPGLFKQNNLSVFLFENKHEMQSIVAVIVHIPITFYAPRDTKRMRR